MYIYIYIYIYILYCTQCVPQEILFLLFQVREGGLALELLPEKEDAVASIYIYIYIYIYIDIQIDR